MKSDLSNALADRLEQGAKALADFANGLSETDWQKRVPHDGRKVGVTVHHVANMYPIEIDLAQKIGAGEPIQGVTWDVVADINAKHAKEKDAVTKAEALDLLRRNSEAASKTIRAMSAEQLAAGTPNSLYGDAPLTCQFFLEDHAVRHSYHHLAKLRAAVKS